MALRTVKRVTITLSKDTLKKMEIKIPKSKRSKFIDDLIRANLRDELDTSYEEEEMFWQRINDKYPIRTDKDSFSLLREIRDSRRY